MSEDALISDGKTTWTGKQETFRVLNEVENKVLKRLKTGEDSKRALRGIQKPQCKSCSQATCYIVEDVSKLKCKGEAPQYKPTKPYVGFIINQSQACVYLDPDETLLYMPVTFCHKCAGSKDGYHDGKYWPGRREETLNRLDTAALTNEEKQQYRLEYDKSFTKGVEVRQAWEEENPKKKGQGRYREKH